MKLLKSIRLLTIFGMGLCLSCTELEVRIADHRESIQIPDTSNTREALLKKVFEVASQYFPGLTPDNTQSFIGNTPLHQATYPLEPCIITLAPKIMVFNDKSCILPIRHDAKGYLWTVCFYFSVELDKPSTDNQNLQDYLTSLGQNCNLDDLLARNTLLDIMSFWTNKIVIGHRLDIYTMKPEQDRSETVVMPYFWDPETQSMRFNLSGGATQRRIAELVESGYEVPQVNQFYCSARPALQRIIEAIKNGHQQITQADLDAFRPADEFEGKQAWTLF